MKIIIGLSVSKIVMYLMFNMCFSCCFVNIYINATAAFHPVTATEEHYSVEKAVWRYFQALCPVEVDLPHSLSHVGMRCGAMSEHMFF